MGGATDAGGAGGVTGVSIGATGFGLAGRGVSRAIAGGFTTGTSLRFFLPPVAAAMMINSRPNPAAPPPA